MAILIDKKTKVICQDFACKNMTHDGMIGCGAEDRQGGQGWGLR
jgi:hypothetical protein